MCPFPTHPPIDAATATETPVVIDFGLTDYQTIWEQQHQLVQARMQQQQPDTLLLGEHPEVITTGRKTQPGDILAPTVPVIAIERGGQATYHGPGQLVAYPIVKLPSHRQDLHAFLRFLEETIIDTLATFDIKATRHPNATGVWVPTETGLLKIASIGVAVKHWVTYHGLALNVSCDLSRFGQIQPCGFDSTVMTSMEALLGQPVEMSAVKATLCKRFTENWRRF